MANGTQNSMEFIYMHFSFLISLIDLDEEPRMTEIWYTPHDENRIEEIFDAMKHCQSLHPDPNGTIFSMHIYLFK